MPYIKPLNRYTIDDQLEYLETEWVPGDAGELNYVISKFCNNYLNGNGLSYANVNELIGALECCKLELYRRVAAPYEDLKIKENGDVYAV